MKRTAGFSLVEALLLVAVVALVTRWMAILTYGPELRTFERRMFESVGIPYNEFQFYGSIVAFGVLCTVAIRRRMRQRSKRGLKYHDERTVLRGRGVS